MDELRLDPNKPTMCVDIDDTLYPTAADLCARIGRDYGVRLEAYRGDMPSLQLARAMGWTPECGRAVVRDYFLHEDILDVAPFADAPLAMARLAEWFNIVAQTARSTESHEHTRIALRRDFDGVLAGVHFPNDRAWIEPLHRVDKLAFMRAIRAVLAVDDMTRHLEGAPEIGIRCGVFGNYVWNTPDLPPGMTRIPNWTAGVDIILGMGLT